MVTHKDVMDTRRSLARGVRIGLAVSGVVTSLVGVFMLVWPEKTAIVFTYVLGTYAVIAGLVYLGISFVGGLGGWARAGHILVGLLFIIAGVVAYANPATSAAVFATVLVVMLGITWIVEGVAALSTLRLSPSKGWSIFFGILSILGGVGLLFAPLWFASVLWLWIAVVLVVLGIMQIVRAITLRASAV